MFLPYQIQQRLSWIVDTIFYTGEFKAKINIRQHEKTRKGPTGKSEYKEDTGTERLQQFSSSNSFKIKNTIIQQRKTTVNGARKSTGRKMMIIGDILRSLQSLASLNIDSNWD
jgi:hypothetical protein